MTAVTPCIAEGLIGLKSLTRCTGSATTTRKPDIPSTSSRLKNVAKGYPAIDCGENVELFKALAAMNDENDREQWFIAEEAKAWVNQGLYAPIGSFEKCLLEHRVGIPARKATVEEIIEHFKKREK